MTKRVDRSNILRYLSQSDFRVLDKRNQAVKLVLEGICGYEIASEVCGVSVKQIRTGVKDSKENRQRREIGRPAIFQIEEIQQWHQKMKEVEQKGEEVVYPVAKSLVCIFSHTFF